jgi:hypothetical protein
MVLVGVPLLVLLPAALAFVLFKSSRKTAQAPAATRREPAPKTANTVRGYVTKHRPTTPLNDLANIVEIWAETAPPVRDSETLDEFMQKIASSWHASWSNGSANEIIGALKSCMQSDLSGPVADYAIMGLNPRVCKSSRYVGMDSCYGDILIDPTGPGSPRTHGVKDSVIEIKVHGAFHVIAKATDSELSYLRHQ